MMRYPVHETFHSWQGEGVHMGRSAFFIRLFGCPVKCPWCDSAGTWHPDYIPDKIERYDANALTELAADAKADFVVITGGEPTIHDLNDLTQALKSHSLKIHLETSGAFPIRGSFDWITLSPKREKMALSENLTQAHELKLIIDHKNAINEWNDTLSLHDYRIPVWLHPEWSQSSNPEVVNGITQFIKAKGFPFRAGWQLHKNYKADQLDPNARPDSNHYQA